jgi:hypothetical protein
LEAASFDTEEVQPMESSKPARVLVVANRTAATPTLVEEIRRRAAQGSTRFTLLIPAVESESADWTLDLALPLMEEAAGGRVEGRVGGSDAFKAIRDEIRANDYDEIIVSTLPQRSSQWLRRDLPSQVQKLGLPLTVVTAPSRSSAEHLGHPV